MEGAGLSWRLSQPLSTPRRYLTPSLPPPLEYSSGRETMGNTSGSDVHTSRNAVGPTDGGGSDGSSPGAMTKLASRSSVVCHLSSDPTFTVLFSYLVRTEAEPRTKCVPTALNIPQMYVAHCLCFRALRSVVVRFYRTLTLFFWTMCDVDICVCAS